MSSSSDGKTTLLGAALHYNDDLKKEVEDWMRQVIRSELNTHMCINNFGTFRRLIQEAQKQDLELLRSVK